MCLPRYAHVVEWQLCPMRAQCGVNQPEVSPERRSSHYEHASVWPYRAPAYFLRRVWRGVWVYGNMLASVRPRSPCVGWFLSEDAKGIHLQKGQRTSLGAFEMEGNTLFRICARLTSRL